MKKTVLVLFMVLLGKAGITQSALADLKFEEAESAFTNKEYETVLTKLDEFDKIYGAVASKSLYLRIVSQQRLLAKMDYYSDEAYLSALKSLRKNTDAYLKAMESEGLDDKFREVYKISEHYKQHSDTEWLKIKKENEARYTDWKKFTDSILTVYQYKPNMSRKEFLAMHPEINSLRMKSYYVPASNQYNLFGIDYTSYTRVDKKDNTLFYQEGFWSYVTDPSDKVFDCKWNLTNENLPEQQHLEFYDLLKNNLLTRLKGRIKEDNHKVNDIAKNRLIINGYDNSTSTVYYIVFSYLPGQFSHVQLEITTNRKFAEW